MRPKQRLAVVTALWVAAFVFSGAATATDEDAPIVAPPQWTMPTLKGGTPAMIRKPELIQGRSCPKRLL